MVIKAYCLRYSGMSNLCGGQDPNCPYLWLCWQYEWISPGWLYSKIAFIDIFFRVLKQGALVFSLQKIWLIFYVLQFSVDFTEIGFVELEFQLVWTWCCNFFYPICMLSIHRSRYIFKSIRFEYVLQKYVNLCDQTYWMTQTVHKK